MRVFIYFRLSLFLEENLFLHFDCDLFFIYVHCTHYNLSMITKIVKKKIKTSVCIYEDVRKRERDDNREDFFFVTVCMCMFERKMCIIVFFSLSVVGTDV